MRIKSYFSRSVEDAMATAREELGDDAVVVNTRRSPAESRHLGEYEVVFGAGVEQPALPVAPSLSAEVADLKKAVEGMRREFTRSAMPPDLSDAYAALTQSEVAPELARDIVESANARQRQVGFQPELRKELEARFTVDSTLGRGETRPRIVSLVGPPGAGKTTAVVKLAVNYGLACRRPVLLLSADTYRIAAAEQLRSYAVILGVEFQVIDTPSALDQVIEESCGKDLILIDTPGFGSVDMESANPLARLLSGRSDIDTHLVLPASMKPVDLRRVVDAFEIFEPRHLLFTRFDETSSFGPIFSEAARTGKPLSFFSTGQRIPEDFEPASARRLLELILPGHPALLSAVAA